MGRQRINSRLGFFWAMAAAGFALLLVSCQHGHNVPMASDGGSRNPFAGLAGTYYFGHGTGVNCLLKLAKQGRFTFSWEGCLGLYDTNYGGAHFMNGMLCLTPKKPNIQESFRGTPTEFFPVRWGARRYLIATNDIVDFCSDINQGIEPRHYMYGHYYLRWNDWDILVAGRPDIPEPWVKYLLSQPIKGKIIQTIGKHEAWIDIGADSGLLEGMVLTAQDHGQLMGSQVRVVAVERDRCRIKHAFTFIDFGFAEGQPVTSRFIVH